MSSESSSPSEPSLSSPSLSCGAHSASHSGAGPAGPAPHTWSVLRRPHGHLRTTRFLHFAGVMQAPLWHVLVHRCPHVKCFGHRSLHDRAASRPAGSSPTQLPHGCCRLSFPQWQSECIGTSHGAQSPSWHVCGQVCVQPGGRGRSQFVAHGKHGPEWQVLGHVCRPQASGKAHRRVHAKGALAGQAT